MIIVASAGLNLPPELAKHCQIAETPQQIVVDGTLHDVRSVDSAATIRKWLQWAKTPPYTLGSSAPEYVALFTELVKRTREVLVVTGTRKFLGTYDAAVAATRVMSGLRPGLDMRVLDTALVEMGAGLIAAYCGAAALAGHNAAEIFAAGQALAAESLQLCAPSSAELLRTSLRLDFRPGAAAQSHGELPIIAMQDGEFRLGAQRPANTSSVNKIVELLQQRYPPGAALWVTITYADEAVQAHKLLAAVKRCFDVSYSLVLPISPAGYIFLGSHSLIISVHPVAAMKLVVKLPGAR